MDYVWSHGPCTADACREALAHSRPMKDSTIRTVLRRLEAKGYVSPQTRRPYLHLPRRGSARKRCCARRETHH